MLDNYRGLVECEKDLCCQQKSMPNLVEFYSFQLLNNRSGVPGNDKLKDVAHEFLGRVKSRLLRELLDCWDAPPRPPSIQIFQEHMVS